MEIACIDLAFAELLYPAIVARKTESGNYLYADILGCDRSVEVNDECLCGHRS
jgi:hypothetical protein